jgi:hypothetical protein
MLQEGYLDIALMNQMENRVKEQHLCCSFFMFTLRKDVKMW